MITLVAASEAVKAQNENLHRLGVRIVIYRLMPIRDRNLSALEQAAREGESPV